MIKTWILDCSFGAASFLPDENSELSELFFKKLGKEINAIVPAIWWYEFNNVVLVAKRRKRISEDQAKIIFDTFESLPIEMDKNFSYSAMKHLFEIGNATELSIYDSAYLELCKRKNAGLASFDEKLVKAAIKEKISIYK
jgi:predicted nucleic acid-binding protein